jgi:peptidoglycan hydrolase-like protein with peptidoglycan-binding domain
MAAIPEQTNEMGDEGPRVRTVQLALARLGYPLRGSGSFAARTLSAVKNFQQAHCLEANGHIGKETA